MRLNWEIRLTEEGVRVELTPSTGTLSYDATDGVVWEAFGATAKVAPKVVKTLFPTAKKLWGEGSSSPGEGLEEEGVQSTNPIRGGGR